MAYFFGLRHAFDADHIAAIDNVTPKMRQEGKMPAVSVSFCVGPLEGSDVAFHDYCIFCAQCG